MPKELADKHQIILKGGEYQEPNDSIEDWLNFLTDTNNLQPGLPDLTVTRYKHRGLWGFYKIHTSFSESKASLKSLHVELTDSIKYFQETDSNIIKTKSTDSTYLAINPHHLKGWIFGIFNQTELENLGIEFLNTELPDLFGQLPKLKTVCLKGSHLVQLPSSFYRLPSLVSLDISSCKIAEVPNELVQLQSLRSLTFSQSCPASVLGSLGGLVSLTCLCDKFDIPTEINQLMSLEYLFLNKVASAPNDFLNAPKLEYLYFHVCEKHVAFAFNKINAMALKELDTNYPAAFASSLDSFHHLEKLTAEGKPIPPPELNSLTNSIKQLHSLTQLTLSGLGITNFEFCLSLLNLQSLNLSRNAIVDVPAGLSNIQNLKSIDLSKNAIIHLPADLSNLHETGSLQLNDNPIFFLPELNLKNEAKQKIILNGGTYEIPLESRESLVDWLSFLTNPVYLQPGLPNLTIILDSRCLDESFVQVSFDETKASLCSLKLELSGFSEGNTEIFQGIDKYTTTITTAESEPSNPHQFRKWIFNLFLNTELNELELPLFIKELPELLHGLSKTKISWTQS